MHPKACKQGAICHLKLAGPVLLIFLMEISICETWLEPEIGARSRGHEVAGLRSAALAPRCNGVFFGRVLVLLVFLSLSFPSYSCVRCLFLEMSKQKASQPWICHIKKVQQDSGYGRVGQLESWIGRDDFKGMISLITVISAEVKLVINRARITKTLDAWYDCKVMWAQSGWGACPRWSTCCPWPVSS